MGIYSLVGVFHYVGPSDNWEPLFMSPESNVMFAVIACGATYAAIRLGLRARRQFRDLRTKR